MPAAAQYDASAAEVSPVEPAQYLASLGITPALMLVAGRSRSIVGKPSGLTRNS